ncbi:TPA: ABC transporter permease [Thermoplasmata archaeon]|nr:ABC transporter permease [Thermoplasmata archaeon]
MRDFRRILLRRVISLFVTFLLVICINFVLFRMMPGDPLQFMVPSDPKIPEEYKKMLIERYDLNDSMTEQFITYIKGVFTLDFGDSFQYKVPAMEYLFEYIPWTLLLVGIASVLMIVIGMLIGIIAAWKRGSLFDSGSLAFSLFFYAMPTFWLAMIMVMAFAVTWDIFPPSRALDIGEEFELTLPSVMDLLHHLVMPVTCLVLVYIATFSLVMRGSLSDVMTEDYITTARAKGLSEKEVLKNHAVPNAMLPMLILIALTIAYIVGGAFMVEWVFEYPGVGWATIDAVYEEDWPVLQAAFFLIAVAVIIANFVSDIVMLYLDPRVEMS